MKKFLISAVFSMCLIQPAFALIVSDPTSYVYEVEQIANQVKEFEQSLESFEKVSISAEKLTDMKKQLEGTYNRIAGLKGRLLKQAERLGGMPDSFRRDIETIQEELMTNDGYLPDEHSMSEWQKTDALMDAVFGDPRSPDFDPSKHADLSYQLKQRALKGSIIQSTLILDGIQKRLKALDNLFGQIDSTENIKDSQDLTNRLIAELLDGQTQMIQLLAHLARAASLITYSGVTEGESARRTALRKSSLKKTSVIEKMRKKLGVKPNQTFKQDRKILRGI